VSVPDVIPVEHNEYHTDTIGVYPDGQFYLTFRGARTGDPIVDGPFRLDEPLRWLVYLHLFDHAGHHRSTTVRVISTTSDQMTTAERDHGNAEAASLLKSLGSWTFCDIAIRPFRVDLDGIVFGLIEETEPERGPWFELHPDGYGFAPPWDGTYST
jgi:formate hydrogenlyase regulatory protein HycA